jgi:hypothetical protein
MFLPAFVHPLALLRCCLLPVFTHLSSLLGRHLLPPVAELFALFGWQLTEASEILPHALLLLR